MRVNIKDLGNNLQLQFGVYMSRGEDPKKNNALTQLLKDYDSVLSTAGANKYLFGTAEPTLLDVYFAPFLETVVDWQ